MATPISFTVYLADGVTPNASATPTFSGGFYKSRAGTNQTVPTIVNIGAGSFVFTPTDPDEALGCVFCIVTGGTPGFVFGSATTGALPFASLLFLNPDGTLATSGTPTIPANSYQNMAGTALTPPSLVSCTAAMWTLTPTSGELAAGGVNFIVSAPAGLVPGAYSGDMIAVVGGGTGAVPVVTAFFPFDPPGSGTIAPTVQIGFDITCADGFAIITMTLGFAGFETREEVYDGNDWNVLYATGASITPITNGFRFRFSRKGGFPGAPRLKIRSISNFGTENV